jgi:colicin import membrane protein
VLARLEYPADDALRWGTALLSAILLHVLIVLLVLLADFDFPKERRPQATGLNMATRLVDSSQLQQSQQQSQALQQQRLREQQAAELRVQRQAERDQALQEQRQREQREREQQQREQAQAAQRQQAEAERQARDQAEQQRLLEAQQQREAEVERQRQQALVQQREQQAENRRKELEAMRQRELEQQRIQDQKLQQELEQLRRQREALTQQNAQTEQQLEQLQQQAEAAAVAENNPASTAEPQPATPGNGVLGSLRDQYEGAIAAAVRAAWVRPPTALDGIECKVAVLQIPGGEVIEASIASPCNADAATQRSIIAAVNRNDLPYQGFEPVFDRRINFIFTDK